MLGESVTHPMSTNGGGVADSPVSARIDRHRFDVTFEHVRTSASGYISAPSTRTASALTTLRNPPSHGRQVGQHVAFDLRSELGREGRMRAPHLVVRDTVGPHLAESRRVTARAAARASSSAERSRQWPRHPAVDEHQPGHRRRVTLGAQQRNVGAERVPSQHAGAAPSRLITAATSSAWRRIPNGGGARWLAPRPRRSIATSRSHRRDGARRSTSSRRWR